MVTLGRMHEPAGLPDEQIPDERSPNDGPAMLPDLGAVGFARWAWRQLTSMRTALMLLLLLAVAAVPGSVYPQRGVDPNQVNAYLDEHPQSGPWLDRLGLFDVYSSVWFSAIYLLLFISLVGCVLPRSRQHWRAMRSAPPRTPRRLSRLPVHIEDLMEPVTGEDGTSRHASTQRLVEAARAALRRRRYRVDVQTDPAGTSVSAERGYLRETGNLVFHLSLVGLLVSVAAGYFVGYRGEVLLVVGDTFANTVTDYDSIDAGTTFEAEDLHPFSLEFNELRVAFETDDSGSQLGAPRSFEAEVAVRDFPDAAPRQETIRVNHPLSVAGTKVYLSGNGYAPVVTVRDARGEVALSGARPFLPQDGNYTSLGVLKAPDAQPEQLALVGQFLPTAAITPQTGPVSIFPDALDPRLVLTAYTGDLGLDDGRPQNVYALDTEGLTQLRTPDGEAVRLLLAPGDSAELPDGAGSVTFEGWERFAAFDVRRDPFTVPALVFALAAMTGLALSLFVPRRRLWVRASTDGQGRTVVEVAGLARGDDAGLAAAVGAVLDDVRTGVAGRPTISNLE